MVKVEFNEFFVPDKVKISLVPRLCQNLIKINELLAKINEIALKVQNPRLASSYKAWHPLGNIVVGNSCATVVTRL